MAARFFRSEAARPLKFGRRKPSRKKGRLLLCTRFSFEREAFYGKRDFPTARAVVDWDDCVCTRRRIFSGSSGTQPHATGLITTFAPIVEKQPVKNAKDIVA